MKKLILLVSILFISAGNANYKVIGIQDGDTITVLDENRMPLKIRLEGIDCPEMGQAFGKNAKQFVSDLCFDKMVRIDAKGKDRYGRTLGWVYLEDGKCINLLLVENGLAWHFKKYSKDASLAEAEIEARIKKINIWSDSFPVAPWDFRHPQTQTK